MFINLCSNRLLLRFAEEVFEGVGGVAFSLLDGVDGADVLDEGVPEKPQLFGERRSDGAIREWSCLTAPNERNQRRRVAEHRDDAEVEYVGVLLVDDRRERLLCGFHVHRDEVGELEAAVGGDLALLAEIFEEDGLALNFLFNLILRHARIGCVGHGASDLLAVNVVAAGNHDEVTVVSFADGCHCIISLIGYCYMVRDKIGIG